MDLGGSGQWIKAGLGEEEERNGIIGGYSKNEIFFATWLSTVASELSGKAVANGECIDMEWCERWWH